MSGWDELSDEFNELSAFTISLLSNEDGEDSCEDIVNNVLGVFNDGVEDEEETTEILSALRKDKVTNSEVFEDGVEVVGSIDVAEGISSLEFSSLGEDLLVAIEGLEGVSRLESAGNGGNS